MPNPPYHGFPDGPVRDLLVLIHAASRRTGHRHSEVLTDLIDLGTYTLRSQLMHDTDAENAYLAAVAVRRTATGNDDAHEYLADIAHGLAILMVAFTVDGTRDDILGQVAAEIGALNGNRDQFFTPPDVARLMVDLMPAGHQDTTTPSNASANRVSATARSRWRTPPNAKPSAAP